MSFFLRSGANFRLLVTQLGPDNCLLLLLLALTEQKILLHSASYSRLTDSATALTSLIYPMRYSHTLVPVLPHSILEVLSSPTPFIIGVHSIHQDHIADLLDVIVVDLDGGIIHIPENMKLQRVMEPLESQVVFELSLVLHPELSQADNAFQSPSSRQSAKSPDMLDKELRAVMLRLMTQLLQVNTTIQI